MAQSEETPEKPLYRRIRRHVIGRPQTYFAVTSLGLEAVCRTELEALQTAPGEAGVETGGIHFQGRLAACYQANLMCRTATRILMRIGSFKATHFAALERQARTVPWELYLKKDAALAVQVSARHSKLYHSRAVAERIREAVGDKAAASPASPSAASPGTPSQSLWVRLHQDRVTLSLDSSGDPLYKRGVKTQGGPAPLRETLAAAALMLAGYDGSMPLCDPMTGSGTFALEGAMMRRRIPPGWYRSFAFMEWPAFREPHWQHLRARTAPPETTAEAPSIFASDRSQTAVAGLKTVLARCGLTDAIELHRQDFFDLTGPAISARPGLIALNPPYGRRLGKPGSASGLIGGILRKLQQDFRGWRIVMVLPEASLLGRFSFPVAAHQVLHGGKPAWLALGEVPR